MEAAAACRDHAAARFRAGQRGFEIEHRLQHRRVGKNLGQSLRSRETLHQSREHPSILHVEEDRLAVALQTDIEAPSLGLAFRCVVPVVWRGVPREPVRVRDLRDWPVRREVDAGVEMFQQIRAQRR